MLIATRHTRIATLLIASTFLAIPAAIAQTTSPCTGMKDEIGCLCAVATGGTVSSKTWARGPDRASFEACVNERGGSLGTKPSSIPSRR